MLASLIFLLHVLKYFSLSCYWGFTLGPFVDGFQRKLWAKGSNAMMLVGSQVVSPELLTCLHLFCVVPWPVRGCHVGDPGCCKEWEGAWLLWDDVFWVESAGNRYTSVLRWRRKSTPYTAWQVGNNRGDSLETTQPYNAWVGEGDETQKNKGMCTWRQRLWAPLFWTGHEV